MKPLRILQIGGVFFFIIIVFVTILFAQGYEYDSRQREIVKKSVVLFEKLPNDAVVIVDGKPADFALSGELRVPPGIYQVEVAKPGMVSWKKNITVPEDVVVRFPEILLMPKGSQVLSVPQREPRPDWRFQSASQSGVFLENPNLHVAKWFPFSSPSDVVVFDLVIPFPFQKLVKVSQQELMGLTKDHHLFSYETEKRETVFNRTAVFTDIAEVAQKHLALDPQGRIWDVSGDLAQPTLFFSAADEIKQFTTVIEYDGLFLFLLQTGQGHEHLLVVTDSSGAILFQERSVDAAFLGGRGLFYATRTHLIHYDLQEKKIVRQVPIMNPLQWFSRIGTSFHFLFLTERGELQFCDEDAENCIFLVGSVDGASSLLPFSSKNQKIFLIPFDKEFTWFDFADSPEVLPTLLKNFVSGVW